jgi:hypothetical protein
MLFDLEDYGTTMRATTDMLRQMNPFYVFDLGLDFTEESAVVGYKIPRVDEILTINETIKASTTSWNGFGGPDGATINLGDGAFSDFHSTASATRDAFIKTMQQYIFGRDWSGNPDGRGYWKISANVQEIESKFNAVDEFFDAYVALGGKWNDFWSCMFSFGYYDKGYVEGDVIPDMYHYYYTPEGQQMRSPVKFKILTQEIYDTYYAALQTLMQKAKAVLVLGGLAE